LFLDSVVESINIKETEILLTLGAGDIDTIVDPIRQTLKNYFKN
jgi:hypothetical protein